MSDKCPKCRCDRKPDDSECPRCGIVYSKFESLQQQRRDNLKAKHFSGKQGDSNIYAKIAAAVIILFVIIYGAAVLKDRKEKKATETVAKQKQEQVKKEQAKARREKLAAERAVAYEKCKLDLKCWAKEHDSDAIFASELLIERFAKYEFEWTSGFMESKISRYAWKNKSRYTLSYFGDKIKFQNGFGAWQNMIYQIDYDPINEKLLNVSVSPGRL